jgi:hypothetical protein
MFVRFKDAAEIHKHALVVEHADPGAFDRYIDDALAEARKLFFVADGGKEDKWWEALGAVRLFAWGTRSIRTSWSAIR